MITLQAALTKATQALLATSLTPRLDAKVLLTHVLNVTKAYLYSHSEQTLSNNALTQFEHLILRRNQGEPIAYILGQQEFWSLTLKVNPAVLIPRPETELLVELALSILPKDECISVVDLGTGSGAIALALAHERPLWQLYATDQSAEALSVAASNAKRHAINNVKFFQGDWCAALPQQRFKAIISNPPYIKAQDPHLVKLSYEPQSALVAAEDGFADLDSIIQPAADYLEHNGLLLLEHGYNQGLIVADKLRLAGYHSIKIFKDLTGHERVTMARKNF